MSSSARSSGEVDALDERDAKALTEVMSVVDSVGIVRDADRMYEVTTQSGSSYIVDVDAPGDARCLCDDQRYRSPEGGCKHARRVLFELGEREIPAWVDEDAIDRQFGVHIADADPQWGDR